MEFDEDMDVPGTPPEVIEAANMVTLNLLLKKSREKYELTYNRFMDFCQKKHTTSRSEHVVIAYFSEISTKMKASTLWSNYSMLRATLNAKEDIDISKYQKLRAFLKRQSDGYKAKKSKVLSGEQIQQFIAEAPDDIYLITKIALIFGVAGACRRDELYNLRLHDIEDLGSKLLVSIPDNKTKKPRSFVVNETYMGLYRKYSAIRPENFENSRFFFKYRNGKGCRQVIGIHQFGKMPQVVAKFLNLPNPEEYTGHCFRRSSATILVDSGADLTSLKRHGGWKSASVAEGYIEDSLNNKIEVANRIFSTGSGKSDDTSNNVANFSGNEVHFSGKEVHPVINKCENCNITINIMNK